MAKKESAKGLSKEAKTTSTSGVDRIREIIFGEMMREYEARFQALEKQMKETAEALKEKMERQDKELHEKLESAMKELRSDKADREKLALLFTQLAEQIKK